MNHLTLAYVDQADRERDVEDALRRRQLLNPTRQAAAPVETPARLPASPHRTPVRVRAAGR